MTLTPGGNLLDIVSDICRSLRLRGHTYFRTEFNRRWNLKVPADRTLIRFHLVLQGDTWVRVDGRDWTHITQGDWVLIPHGAAQTLANNRQQAAPTPLNELLATHLSADGVLQVGPSGASPNTRLLCGFCTFEDTLQHPMCQALPAQMVMSQQRNAASPWLTDALRLITAEANEQTAGASVIVDRLVEILFIQALRMLQTEHTDDNDLVSPTPAPPGFMHALRDPFLSRALRAIHNNPESPWTVTTLAQTAAMSRSSFARRFHETVGRSPNEYLTEWRLLKAAQLLRDSTLSVEDVANRVGYQSASSLTRRFTRVYDQGPAAYRRSWRNR